MGQSELRAVFRVKVAGALVNLIVNNRHEVALLDVNSEGFGIASEAQFRIGERVTIAGESDGQKFCGQAIVRNVRQMGTDRCRYGLQTAGRELALRRGLRAIAIGVQRRQLRRMAERR